MFPSVQPLPPRGVLTPGVSWLNHILTTRGIKSKKLARTVWLRNIERLDAIHVHVHIVQDRNKDRAVWGRDRRQQGFFKHYTYWGAIFILLSSLGKTLLIFWDYQKKTTGRPKPRGIGPDGPRVYMYMLKKAWQTGTGVARPAHCILTCTIVSGMLVLVDMTTVSAPLCDSDGGHCVLVYVCSCSTVARHSSMAVLPTLG